MARNVVLIGVVALAVGAGGAVLVGGAADDQGQTATTPVTETQAPPPTPTPTEKPTTQPATPDNDDQADPPSAGRTSEDGKPSSGRSPGSSREDK